LPDKAASSSSRSLPISFVNSLILPSAAANTAGSAPPLPFDDGGIGDAGAEPAVGNAGRFYSTRHQTHK
jgi:hypothetical protein